MKDLQAVFQASRVAARLFIAQHVGALVFDTHAFEAACEAEGLEISDAQRNEEVISGLLHPFEDLKHDIIEKRRFEFKIGNQRWDATLAQGDVIVKGGWGTYDMYSYPDLIAKRMAESLKRMRDELIAKVTPQNATCTRSCKIRSNAK